MPNAERCRVGTACTVLLLAMKRLMNWLTNVVRPKIRNILKRETPDNLWIKCPDTGQLVFYKDVEATSSSSPDRTITCA